VALQACSALGSLLDCPEGADAADASVVLCEVLKAHASAPHVVEAAQAAQVALRKARDL